jgi:hypothetical protein
MDGALPPSGKPRQGKSAYRFSSSARRKRRMMTRRDRSSARGCNAVVDVKHEFRHLMPIELRHGLKCEPARCGTSRKAVQPS